MVISNYISLLQKFNDNTLFGSKKLIRAETNIPNIRIFFRND